jgi:hypothetical protein
MSLPKELESQTGHLHLAQILLVTLFNKPFFTPMFYGDLYVFLMLIMEMKIEFFCCPQLLSYTQIQIRVLKLQPGKTTVVDSLQPQEQ